MDAKERSEWKRKIDNLRRDIEQPVLGVWDALSDALTSLDARDNEVAALMAHVRGLEFDAERYREAFLRETKGADEQRDAARAECAELRAEVDRLREAAASFLSVHRNLRHSEYDAIAEWVQDCAALKNGGGK